MSYSVKSIEVFEKQAKRLIKKYSSLKVELLALIQELKENPEKGNPIGKGCIKSVLLLLQKAKENQVVLELLLKP